MAKNKGLISIIVFVFALIFLAAITLTANAAASNGYWYDLNDLYGESGRTYLIEDKTINITVSPEGEYVYLEYSELLQFDFREPYFDFVICLTLPDGTRESIRNNHLPNPTYPGLPIDWPHWSFELGPHSVSGEYELYMLVVVDSSREERYWICYSNIVEFSVVIYELPPEPVKEGYSFAGWFYDEDLTRPYQGEKITGDMSFYAKFTPIQYNITYNLNGGSLTGQKTQYTVEDETYILPTPTRAGYEFRGWYPNPNFTGNSSTAIAAGSMGDRTYYAKWEAITYTVTFYLEGSLYKQIIVNYGAILKGYYYADSRMSAVYFYMDAEHTVIYDPGTEICMNTVLYASSGFEIYVSLTYSVNGVDMYTDLFFYNSQITSLRTYVQDGYTFGGWYYDSSFTKPVLETDYMKSNTTVYAQLTVIEELTFWEKIGAWFGSYGWIIIVVVAIGLIVGGIGYAVSRKKNS